jgi:hypothetical protein
MLLMRMAQSGADVSIDNLFSKLTTLEKRLKDGGSDSEPPSAGNPHAASFVKEPETSGFSGQPEDPTPDDVPDEDDDIPEPIEDRDDGEKEEPQLGLWKQFLEAIREQRMSTYSFLTSGRFCGIENGHAIVGFGPENAYNKKHLEEKSVKQLLEDTLETIVGEPTRIKLIIESESSRSPAPARPKAQNEDKAKAAREAKEKRIEQVLKDPIIKKTVELFKGKIVYVSG